MNAARDTGLAHGIDSGRGGRDALGCLPRDVVSGFAGVLAGWLRTSL
jgi:hypothetical protein